MTDEELIAQLREGKITQDIRYTIEDAAADRIEELVKERDGLLRVVTDNHVALLRAEAAEAKLAKAVEFFQEVRRNGDTRFASMAIAVLAELEKAK